MRCEHREAFDRLFTRARIHAAEATAAARAVPFDAMVMGILLSQELEIERLRGEVDELKGARTKGGPP